MSAMIPATQGDAMLVPLMRVTPVLESDLPPRHCGRGRDFGLLAASRAWGRHSKLGERFRCGVRIDRTIRRAMTFLPHEIEPMVCVLSLGGGKADWKNCRVNDPGVELTVRDNHLTGQPYDGFPPGIKTPIMLS